MPALFDPAELELLMDLASEYIAGSNTLFLNAPSCDGSPIFMHADEQLKHNMDGLPALFGKLFHPKLADLELTRLRHSSGRVLRVELEITNRAETIGFRGDVFHPMLLFYYDTELKRGAKLSLGFRLSDSSDGLLIKARGPKLPHVYPHRLPRWWTPAGYSLMAEQFLEDLSRLADIQVPDGGMMHEVTFHSSLFTLHTKAGISEAFARHGENLYALLRVLMRESVERVNESVFEQLRQGMDVEAVGPLMGEWQDMAGRFLREAVDQPATQRPG